MLLAKWVITGLLSFGLALPGWSRVELSRDAESALQRVQKESGNTLKVDWDKKLETPQLITGNLTETSRHSPEWIAYEYLHKIRSLYGLNRVREDLSVLEVREEAGGRIVVELQRQLFGKPVYGDILVMEMDGNRSIRRIEGTIHPGLVKERLNRPMYPAISRKQALTVALEHTDNRYLPGDAKVEEYYLPDRKGIPLVYVVTFKKEDSKQAEMVRIHSMSGRVIE